MRNRAVRTSAVVVVALGCATLTVGCSSKTPDYQSVPTTSTTATATGTPVPIGQYLRDQGVGAQSVPPDSLTDLSVSIPTPTGWSKKTNVNLPPGTEVIGKGDKYAAAILSVLKLGGNFDAAEAIRHAYDDQQQLQNFRRLDSSGGDFHGFPSAMIQGSHDVDGQRVHSWSRTVIATGSPPDSQRYLVQLTIFTLAEQAAAQAADVEKIMAGFTVAAR